MSLGYGGRRLGWLAATVLSLLGAQVALAPTHVSADGGLYTVQAGDTLSHLSLRLGGTVDDWVRANGLADPDFIRTGQVLTVPAPANETQSGGTRPAQVTSAAPLTEMPAAPAAQTTAGDELVHHVAPGDTLWGIGQRYGVRAYDLQVANGLADANYIRPGQRLVIPAVTYPVPAPRHGAPLAAPPEVTPADLQGPVSATETPWLVADFSQAPAFKLTHYCLYGTMASGRFVYPFAVAADKSVFPLGTRVIIEGLAGVFTVEDRFAWDAGQLRLDLWIPTCEEAIQRGVQYRRVLRLPD